MCFNCGNPNHKEETENADMPFVLSPVLEPRKIFCDECKYYKESVIFNGDKLKNKCFHPKVFKHERYREGTPISKGFLHKWTYPGDCYAENEDNKCLLFEQQDCSDRSIKYVDIL